MTIENNVIISSQLLAGFFVLDLKMGKKGFTINVSAQHTYKLAETAPDS